MNLADHLWQSTAFAVIAGLLTLALRANRARVRHWLWFAASVKFLIPLSLLISLGSEVEWKTAPVPATVAVAVNQVVLPFSIQVVPTPIEVESRLPEFLLALWAVGALGFSAAWLVRWRRMRSAVRRASRLNSGVMVSDTDLEPGVFGIFRPVLELPKGIFERLTPAQLKAIIAHEHCHIRHHDNLLAAIHMSVETIFWFHPLVWWIGKRMVEERELACDEDVLRILQDPQTYAEGILNVCKLYTESPLPCVSGVTGADLKKRIEAIMKNRRVFRLSASKKLILVTAAIASLALPLCVGLLRAQESRLLDDLGKYSFDVAIIRPGKPDGGKLMGIGVSGRPGRYEATGVTVRDLILAAYGGTGGMLAENRLVGGPKWIETNVWDLVAQASGDQAPLVPLLGKRLQTLLQQRFHLRLHTEQRQMPIFELTVSKPGKLTRSKADCMDLIAKGALSSELPAACGIGTEPGEPRHLRAGSATMTQLGQVLARFPSIARPVVDRTGLDGIWDFDVKFMPTDPSGVESPLAPPIIAALQQQLGLKLVAARRLVEVLVVDQIEMPDQN